jgi:hypothetical protein
MRIIFQDELQIFNSYFTAFKPIVKHFIQLKNFSNYEFISNAYAFFNFEQKI